MGYIEAYTYIFKQPGGMKNLALQAVCILIPVVGPLVLIGYLRDVFLDLHENPNAPCRQFSFDRFGDYLGRGVWPFVVSLVASLVMVPMTWGLMFVAFVVANVAHPEGAVAALLIIAGVGLYILIILFFQLIMGPLMLRALLMQDFGTSFDRAFLTHFILKMWPQLLLKQLFIMVTSLPIALVGVLMCGVGVYAAAALITMANWLLQFDVYETYLKRGGIEIPIKSLGVPGGPQGFTVGSPPAQ